MKKLFLPLLFTISYFQNSNATAEEFHNYCEELVYQNDEIHSYQIPNFNRLINKLITNNQYKNIFGTVRFLYAVEHNKNKSGRHRENAKDLRRLIYTRTIPDEIFMRFLGHVPQKNW